MKKILLFLGTLGLSVFLVSCGNNQQASDRKNTRTNETSAYVEKHLNHGNLTRYINSTTYNKPTNTIEFHLTYKMSKEMRGKRPDQYHTTAVSFADRNDFHRIVKNEMNQLHKQAHNRSARAKLIYQQ